VLLVVQPGDQWSASIDMASILAVILGRSADKPVVATPFPSLLRECVDNGYGNES